MEVEVDLQPGDVEEEVGPGTGDGGVDLGIVVEEKISQRINLREAYQKEWQHIKMIQKKKSKYAVWETFFLLSRHFG